MKKILFLIVAGLSAISVFAQHADSLGVDNSPLLNIYESEFFNKRFEKERDGFDFTGKRVLFVSGSNARTISDKISYLNDIKEWQEKYGRDISSNILLLTEEEKKLCGYDVIVTRWNMVLLSPRGKARLLNKINGPKSK